MKSPQAILEAYVLLDDLSKGDIPSDLSASQRGQLRFLASALAWTLELDVGGEMFSIQLEYIRRAVVEAGVLVEVET